MNEGYFDQPPMLVRSCFTDKSFYFCDDPSKCHSLWGGQLDQAFFPDCSHAIHPRDSTGSNYISQILMKPQQDAIHPTFT